MAVDMEHPANDAKNDQAAADANDLANNDAGAPAPPANETSHFSDDSISDAGSADAGGDGGGE